MALPSIHLPALVAREAGGAWKGKRKEFLFTRLSPDVPKGAQDVTLGCCLIRTDVSRKSLLPGRILRKGPGANLFPLLPELIGIRTVQSSAVACARRERPSSSLSSPSFPSSTSCSSQQSLPTSSSSLSTHSRVSRRVSFSPLKGSWSSGKKESLNLWNGAHAVTRELRHLLRLQERQGLKGAETEFERSVGCAAASGFQRCMVDESLPGHAGHPPLHSAQLSSSSSSGASLRSGFPLASVISCTECSPISSRHLSPPGNPLKKASSVSVKKSSRREVLLKTLISSAEGLPTKDLIFLLKHVHKLWLDREKELFLSDHPLTVQFYLAAVSALLPRLSSLSSLQLKALLVPVLELTVLSSQQSSSSSLPSFSPSAGTVDSGPTPHHHHSPPYSAPSSRDRPSCSRPRQIESSSSVEDVPVLSSRSVRSPASPSSPPSLFAVFHPLLEGIGLRVVRYASALPSHLLLFFFNSLVRMGYYHVPLIHQVTKEILLNRKDEDDHKKTRLSPQDISMALTTFALVQKERSLRAARSRILRVEEVTARKQVPGHRRENALKRRNPQVLDSECSASSFFATQPPCLRAEQEVGEEGQGQEEEIKKKCSRPVESSSASSPSSSCPCTDLHSLQPRASSCPLPEREALQSTCHLSGFSPAHRKTFPATSSQLSPLSHSSPQSPPQPSPSVFSSLSPSSFSSSLSSSPPACLASSLSSSFPLEGGGEEAEEDARQERSLSFSFSSISSASAAVTSPAVLPDCSPAFVCLLQRLNRCLSLSCQALEFPLSSAIQVLSACTRFHQASSSSSPSATATTTFLPSSHSSVFAKRKEVAFIQQRAGGEDREDGGHFISNASGEKKPGGERTSFSTRTATGRQGGGLVIEPGEGGGRWRSEEANSRDSLISDTCTKLFQVVILPSRKETWTPQLVASAMNAIATCPALFPRLSSRRKILEELAERLLFLWRRKQENPRCITYRAEAFKEPRKKGGGGVFDCRGEEEKDLCHECREQSNTRPRSLSTSKRTTEITTVRGIRREVQNVGSDDARAPGSDPPQGKERKGSFFKETTTAVFSSSSSNRLSSVGSPLPPSQSLSESFLSPETGSEEAVKADPIGGQRSFDKDAVCSHPSFCPSGERRGILLVEGNRAAPAVGCSCCGRSSPEREGSSEGKAEAKKEQERDESRSFSSNGQMDVSFSTSRKVHKDLEETGTGSTNVHLVCSQKRGQGIEDLPCMPHENLGKFGDTSRSYGERKKIVSFSLALHALGKQSVGLSKKALVIEILEVCSEVLSRQRRSVGIGIGQEAAVSASSQSRVMSTEGLQGVTNGGSRKPRPMYTECEEGSLYKEWCVTAWGLSKLLSYYHPAILDREGNGELREHNSSETSVEAVSEALSRPPASRETGNTEGTEGMTCGVVASSREMLQQGGSGRKQGQGYPEREEEEEATKNVIPVRRTTPASESSVYCHAYMKDEETDEGKGTEREEEEEKGTRRKKAASEGTTCTSLGSKGSGLANWVSASPSSCVSDRHSAGNARKDEIKYLLETYASRVFRPLFLLLHAGLLTHRKADPIAISQLADALRRLLVLDQECDGSGRREHAMASGCTWLAAMEENPVTTARQSGRCLPACESETTPASLLPSVTPGEDSRSPIASTVGVPTPQKRVSTSTEPVEEIECSFENSQSFVDSQRLMPPEELRSLLRCIAWYLVSFVDEFKPHHLLQTAWLYVQLNLLDALERREHTPPSSPSDGFHSNRPGTSGLVEETKRPAADDTVSLAKRTVVLEEAATPDSSCTGDPQHVEVDGGARKRGFKDCAQRLDQTSSATTISIDCLCERPCPVTPTSQQKLPCDPAKMENDSRERTRKKCNYTWQSSLFPFLSGVDSARSPVLPFVISGSHSDGRKEDPAVSFVNASDESEAPAAATFMGCVLDRLRELEPALDENNSFYLQHLLRSYALAYPFVLKRHPKRVRKFIRRRLGEIPKP